MLGAGRGWCHSIEAVPVRRDDRAPRAELRGQPTVAGGRAVSRWLAAALSQLQAIPAQECVPLVAVVPEGPNQGCFGTNGTIGTGVSGAADRFGPLPFEEEFAALCGANPTDDDRRWRQACVD